MAKLLDGFLTEMVEETDLFEVTSFNTDRLMRRVALTVVCGLVFLFIRPPKELAQFFLPYPFEIIKWGY